MPWPPDGKSLFIGKTLMLGKIEGRKRREQMRMRWLDSITDSTDMNLSKPWETEGQRSLICYTPWRCKKLDDLATEQQQYQKWKINIWVISRLNTTKKRSSENLKSSQQKLPKLKPKNTREKILECARVMG